MLLHNLGFPRIGAQRELKFALEKYWAGKSGLADLQKVASELRYQNLQTQIAAGIELLPVNDFALYDQVLNMSTLLGVIPRRFKEENFSVDVSFAMARGKDAGAGADSADACCSCSGGNAHASAMKKWFDTNYHFLVPELEEDLAFSITDERLFDEVDEALLLKKDAENIDFKVVLVGPLTYLYLAEDRAGRGSKLELLAELLEVYKEIFARLAAQGISWIQLDEPILGLELDKEWQAGFVEAYNSLNSVAGVKILLTTYFETLGDNLDLVCGLPIDGLHFDGVRGAKQLSQLVESFPAEKVLSLGLIDGRNIWRTDLAKAHKILAPALTKFGDNLWLAPSCSLLHLPVDLDAETQLNSELKSYLSFATQKLEELNILKEICLGRGASELEANKKLIASKKSSGLINDSQVQTRIKALDSLPLTRKLPFADRIKLQKSKLNLPLLPTTTIGSFPQTTEIRQARAKLKRGELSQDDYIASMQQEIKRVVKIQEDLDLDVLVHGEPERNDMVEYFGENLSGFAFTQFGWVQSYGSRCVKPPILFGDVARPNPITVSWSEFAQKQTSRPMKGMLTGAVTILQWSFVRNDQSFEETCNQVALALRDEVLDLEAAGINVIQIDEAALREGLPLKQSDWADYLRWAINSFRLTASGVKDTTQIHTHMCYSEFNDIIESIAQMDADVITIETSRGQGKLLQAFSDFNYPNEIGPGVYDIHSPNIPSVAEMLEVIKQASEFIPLDRLWVNPDCGLKTRGWEETLPALKNMVLAAKELRS